MAKNEALFGYALIDNTTHAVCINDIDRPFSRRHKFFCPHCHNEMYATFGKVQRPHFRHYGNKCQYSKYLHDLAEHIFCEEYTKCLNNNTPFFFEANIPRPCNESCVLWAHSDCKAHYIQKTVDLTKEYKIISLESRVDIDNHYRRPDILLRSETGKQLWVEIWVSHETEEKKRNEGRIIEIKIETEEDLKILQQHFISQNGELTINYYNIISDGMDELITDDGPHENAFPCEKYYCFEADKSDFNGEIIDYIKTTISEDLLYRLILRLNWKRKYDSEEGVKGKQVSSKDLYDYCLQRYFVQRKNWSPVSSKPYDALIVSEWNAKSLESPSIQKSTSSFSPYLQETTSSTPVSVNIMEMVWVDLGLPSNTLWAMNDLDEEMSFESAKKAFDAYLPSVSKIAELREHCTRVWDDNAQALVFTGPNGNSISFPCKKSNKSYWLNDQENGILGFRSCMHIGPDGHFRTNKMEAESTLFIRLIK